MTPIDIALTCRPDPQIQPKGRDPLKEKRYETNHCCHLQHLPKSLGYAPVNDTAYEFKTFRPYPVAIDNIVYREGDMTPEAFGMMNSDASDHNLLWCRFTLH